MNWTSLIGIALWALIPGFIAKKKGRSFWGYYFLSFLITPLITMIITICLKRITPIETTHYSSPMATAQVTQQKSVFPISNSNPSSNYQESVPASMHCESSERENRPTTSTLRKIRFCRRCGFELIENSEFCSRCGNEIEKENTL